MWPNSPSRPWVRKPALRRQLVQLHDRRRGPRVSAALLDDPIAQTLEKAYAGLKRRWKGESFLRPNRVRRHVGYFKRAAARIRALQARGYPIEPARFVWAVFSVFGARTYPEHFVS